MNVLNDECLPRRLKHELPGHHVATVSEMGWGGTKNGALLRLAEADFDVFVTIDQNLQYQQHLRSLTLRIIVLVAPNNRLETLRPLMLEVASKVLSLQPGDLVRVAV